MELDTTDEKRRRMLWLIGDSYPAAWVNDLKEPLDPRHPTRHNILTPVFDYLQDEVYRKAGLRLDIAKCYMFNAAEKQAYGSVPDWNWNGPSIKDRIRKLSQLFNDYKPQVVITFGGRAYRFAAHALRPEDSPGSMRPKASELGGLFRKAAESWSGSQPNLFPLLHAYVARSGWRTAGEDYSERKDGNYFEFVGRKLGDVLLKNARKLPIWCDASETTSPSIL